MCGSVCPPLLTHVCPSVAVLTFPCIFYTGMAIFAAVSAPHSNFTTIYAIWVVFFALGFTLSPSLWRIFLSRLLTRCGVLKPFDVTEMGVPMNVNYINERVGLFQIIVIGETVIAGSAGFKGFFNHTRMQQFACVASLALAVQTKLLYYELQGEQKRHALRISGRRGMMFFLSHLFVFMFVVMVGSLLHEVSGGGRWDATQKGLFLVASGGFQVSMSWLSLCHEGVGYGLRVLRKEYRVGARLVLAAVLVTLGCAANELLGDCECIVLVMAVFAIDFLVEFNGAKFSREKCGCDVRGEAPNLARIITASTNLSRQATAQTGSVNGSLSRQATIETTTIFRRGESVISVISEGGGEGRGETEDSLVNGLRPSSQTTESSMDSIDRATARSGGVPQEPRGTCSLFSDHGGRSHHSHSHTIPDPRAAHQIGVDLLKTCNIEENWGS